MPPDFKHTLSLILLIVISFTSCATMPAARTEDSSADNLKFLTRLDDTNEKVFFYYKFCLPGQSVNQAFLDNYKIASDQLFDAYRTGLRWEPSYILSHVKERRNLIRSKLGAYYAKNGCKSVEAAKAQDHYRIFSGQNDRGTPEIAK